MRKFLFIAISLIATFSFCSQSSSDELRLARIFNDHMVLQCQKPVKVWGWSEKGQNVTVNFAGQSVKTKSNETGAWQVTLKPLLATAKGRELEVTCNLKSLKLTDVVVGEVWLASGQSNMAMNVGSVARKIQLAREQIASAKFPGIRFCRINEKESKKPLGDLKTTTKWTVCSPDSVSRFSAAAFYFARELHHKIEVPIGMIDSSRGGTPIEPFIPRSAFDSHATLRRELELGDKEDLRGIWKLSGGVRARDANWLPARLFNSRLAPIFRFAVRGAIWYQGESNCGIGEDPRDNQHKMRALIKGWRNESAEKNLPLYFVQLPGSGASAGCPICESNSG